MNTLQTEIKRRTRLTQELFTLVSCFEIALRNAIDRVASGTLGNDWLKQSASKGGIFAQHQFKATKKILLKTFPSKPKSTRDKQYNNSYIFNELAVINKLRNRMAHHEPICFLPTENVKNSNYARLCYFLILDLFNWMGIDAKELLLSLDEIIKLCDQIDCL